MSEARRLEKNGDMDGALRELNLLVERFSKDRLAPAAWREIAQAHAKRGENFAARAAVDRLAKNFPRSADTAVALVLRGKILFEEARSKSDLETAQAELRRIPVLFGRDLVSGSEARVAARVLSAEIALLLGDPAGAIGDVVPALEDEAPVAQTARAQLVLIRALLLRGETAAALEEAARVTSENSAIPAVPQVRVQVEQLLELYERTVLRPSLGESSWRATSRYPTGGVELRAPTGLAAADDGRLLVVDEKAKIALLLDAAGQEIRRATLSESGRPVWRGDQAWIVADRQILAPFGGFTPPLNDPQAGKGFLKNVYAGAPGGLNDWWIAAKGRSILRVQPSGGQEILSERRPEPRDVAVDLFGRVYILDQRNLQVLRLDVAGGDPATVARADWKRPEALTVDALGNLYVLDRGHRRIDIFRANGELRTQIGPHLGGGVELRQPQDLTVDGRGRLFITDARLPFVVVLE